MDRNQINEAVYNKTAFALSVSTKDKPLIIFGYNKFREVRTNEISGDVVWRCTNKSCNVRLKTDQDKKLISVVSGTHIHDEIHVEILKRHLATADIRYFPEDKMPVEVDGFMPPTKRRKAILEGLIPGPGQSRGPPRKNTASSQPQPSTSQYNYVQVKTKSETTTPAAATSQDEPQHVCVRWNTFHENMRCSFPDLLSNEKYVDVSIACEGRIIKAHKLVLSSCSTYFDSMLSEYAIGVQPIIVMPRDISYWEIKLLLDFMYTGEITVERDHLPNLLQIAEQFQIKGLTGSEQVASKETVNNSSSTEQQQATQNKSSQKSPKRKRKSQQQQTSQEDSTNIPSLPESIGEVSITKIGAKKAKTIQNNESRSGVKTEQNDNSDDSDNGPDYDNDEDESDNLQNDNIQEQDLYKTPDIGTRQHHPHEQGNYLQQQGTYPFHQQGNYPTQQAMYHQQNLSIDNSIQDNMKLI